MDKTITTEDLASSTDRVLAEVQGGETYTVISGGKAVAQIVPTRGRVATREEKARKDAAWGALLDHLDRQPALNLGPWSRDEGYE